MEIIKRSNYTIKTFKIDCGECESELEYELKDVKSGRYDTRSYIKCPVCGYNIYNLRH